MAKQQKNKRRNRFSRFVNPTGSRKALTASGMRGAALISMSGLLLTKITGFLREILIVPKLGYGVVSDGYVLGFSIPDLFYEMLIGGAISAAITPTLSAAIENDDEESAWHAISTFFTVMALLMIGLIIVGELFAPQFFDLFHADKAAEVRAIATRVSRVLFFQTFFMMMVALMNGVLASNKIFGLPAFGNTIYNVCSMLAILLLGTATPSGAVRVAVGIVIAAFIFFIYQTSLAKPYLGYFKPNLDVKKPEIRMLVRLAVPALISGSVLQVNNVILQTFTGQFSGSITSLRHAQTLWTLPYGVITVGIGGVMLPNLSGFFAKRDLRNGRRLFSSTLRIVLYLVIPVSIYFMVSNFETVQAVFQWNPATYTHGAVQQTGYLLTIFSISMVTQSIVFIYNQAFYSLRKSWITLVTGLVTLVLNPLFAALYINVFNMGIMGVSLAHASYSICSAIILTVVLRKVEPQATPTRMLPFVWRVMLAAWAAGMLGLGLNRLIDVRDAGKIAQLSVYVFKALLVFAAYYGVTLLLRIPEARRAKDLILRKLKLKQS